MQDRWNAVQRRQRGFTLVELLATIGVIGVLAAIAIPQYASFRQRGFDAQAITDLRHAAISQEARFNTAFEYVDCSNASCNDPVLPGFEISDRVRLLMFRGALLGNSFFLGISWSTSGSGHIYVWNSVAGGLT